MNEFAPIFPNFPTRLAVDLRLPEKPKGVDGN